MFEIIPGPGRREGPWRRGAPLLARFWLVFFYTAAGYAKLTEPPHLLTILLSWPAWTDSSVVRLIGGLEALMGIGLLLATAGLRLVTHVCGAVLLAHALSMAVVHALVGDTGLVLLNITLVFAALALLGALADEGDLPSPPR